MRIARRARQTPFPAKPIRNVDHHQALAPPELSLARPSSGRAGATVGGRVGRPRGRASGHDPRSPAQDSGGRRRSQTTAARMRRPSSASSAAARARELDREPPPASPAAGPRSRRAAARRPHRAQRASWIAKRPSAASCWGVMKSGEWLRRSLSAEARNRPCSVYMRGLYRFGCAPKMRAGFACRTRR